MLLTDVRAVTAIPAAVTSERRQRMDLSDTLLMTGEGYERVLDTHAIEPPPVLFPQHAEQFLADERCSGARP